MKNHKIGNIDSLGKLMVFLVEQDSIYFVPSGRVMPTKFFTGWSWNKSEALIRHFKAGNFKTAERYDVILRRGIKSILEDCPKIVNKKVS